MIAEAVTATGYLPLGVLGFLWGRRRGRIMPPLKLPPHQHVWSEWGKSHETNVLDAAGRWEKLDIQEHSCLGCNLEEFRTVRGIN